MSTWWERASVEDRLAQIDGGIECGMTSRQIAMNCGAPIFKRDNAVLRFGKAHGRHFLAKNSAGRSREGGLSSSLVRTRKSGFVEYEISTAFDIFGTREPTERFIDAIPGEAA